jgi:uncharacterized circularly permuted ATP-grasp superfamily protein
MDETASRAVEDYERLLRDEKAHVQQLQAGLADRLRAAKLTFGGRLLCPFLRPNFVSPEAYDRIRDVCRLIFQAVETVEARLGEALWERVDLTPAERELVAIHPGYARSSPSARLDSFLTPSAYQFVELNAESPAGIAYSETLEEVFLELPVMEKFQERWTLRRFQVRQKLLDTLLACYREAGGRQEHPTIAIVDFEDVPTRTEHHLFREFFAEAGHPAFVCDPRDLVYEKGALRYEGRTIDIVYKRLLVNELIERAEKLQPLLQAAKDRAVTVVNPFRCKPIHKKAIFAVLTDESVQALLTEPQRAAIAAHVPWTRRVREGKDTRGGRTVDLPLYIREHRERLVLKPNDEYGGKGVFLGWESTEADWEKALAEALRSPYVVQEKVELQRHSFPELALDLPELAFKDVVVDLDPFLFQGEVEGFLTRLSGSSLANVTSGGGQVPAFVVERR